MHLLFADIDGDLMSWSKVGTGGTTSNSLDLTRQNPLREDQDVCLSGEGHAPNWEISGLFLHLQASPTPFVLGDAMLADIREDW